jgi:hypothetical protein
MEARPYQQPSGQCDQQQVEPIAQSSQSEIELHHGFPGSPASLIAVAYRMAVSDDDGLGAEQVVPIERSISAYCSIIAIRDRLCSSIMAVGLSE